MPFILRKFLLATGERGLGYAAVFGDEPVSLYDFNVLFYCQQRVLMASTDEGRRDIETALAVRHAITLEEREAAGLPTPQQVPFDPERMTPEQLDAWRRANDPY